MFVFALCGAHPYSFNSTSGEVRTHDKALVTYVRPPHKPLTPRRRGPSSSEFTHAHRERAPQRPSHQLNPRPLSPFPTRSLTHPITNPTGSALRSLLRLQSSSRLSLSALTTIRAAPSSSSLICASKHHHARILPVVVVIFRLGCRAGDLEDRIRSARGRMAPAERGCARTRRGGACTVGGATRA